MVAGPCWGHGAQDKGDFQPSHQAEFMAEQMAAHGGGS